jgi:tetratricopeptide (TPR) repeat protein
MSTNRDQSARKDPDDKRTSVVRSAKPYSKVLLAALSAAVVASVGSSDPLENPESKWSYHQMGCVDSIHRHSDSTQALCEKSLEFALRAGNEDQIIRALGDLAVAHHSAGRKADALGIYLRKIDRLHKLGADTRKEDMARTLLVSAGLSEELGDHESAIALLDEATERSAGGGYHVDIAVAKASYWVKRGQLDKADQTYLRAVETCGAYVHCKIQVLDRYAWMLRATDRHTEEAKVQTQIDAYIAGLKPVRH